MVTMSYQPNRRSFLIASGMTALASTRVLGANDTLRVGVIGAGGRMGNLLDAADKLSSYPYQIVAVSDVYGPRCDAIKERSKDDTGMCPFRHSYSHIESLSLKAQI